MSRLDNKVAIVTGSGSGIGKASAILFAKEGAKVTVSCRTIETGEEVVRTIKKGGGEAIFVRTDVSKVEDVKRMIRVTVDTYGRLDVIFNNAGIQGDIVYTADLTEEGWDKIIDINLKGVWLGMKYAIPEMLKTGGGSIINTASICAMEAVRGDPCYSASKGGIIALSRVTAIEYVTKNIRVNCINPGPILTVLQEEIQRLDPKSFNQMVAEIPMGRLGKPEEVAQLALFLASDESSYITGSAFLIDGGVTASCLVHDIYE